MQDDEQRSALEEVIEQSFGVAGAAFYKKFGCSGCLILLIIVVALLFWLC